MNAQIPPQPPRDYQAMRDMLIRQSASLPKRLRQVAEVALDRPDEFAFGTAARIADIASVQPSTLVRFAKAFGYSGFSDLQNVFRARLREGFPDYRDRLAAVKGEGPLHLFEGFAQSAVISLQRAKTSINSDTLSQAVALLARSDTLYLAGARRVFPVAAYLAYACGKLGLKFALVDHVGGLGPEQAAHAGVKDALIAISFAPYAPGTLDLASALRERGVPIVAITDSAFSPLAPLANVWLELAEADFGAFRSLAATFALVMTLAVAVADARGMATPP